MENTQLQKTNSALSAEACESALILNDLSKLTPNQRLSYILKVCESLKLNPLTKPFGFIAFRSGELKLYATRDCTDQLRKRDKVSVGLPEPIALDGCMAFRVQVKNAEGRTDSAVGAVAADKLRGEALANAVMKAETKAKRRATLSICGLGLPDESEISSIEGARVVDENYAEAKITESKAPSSLPTPKEQPASPVEPSHEGLLKAFPGSTIEPQPEFYYDLTKVEEKRKKAAVALIDQAGGRWWQEHNIWVSPVRITKLGRVFCTKAEVEKRDSMPPASYTDAEFDRRHDNVLGASSVRDSREDPIVESEELQHLQRNQ